MAPFVTAMKLGVLGVLASHAAKISFKKASVNSWARELCEKNFWMTMDTCMQELSDNTSYVITGDIDAMWTRDSTAQIWPYLSMLEKYRADAQSKTPEEATSLDHLERLLAGVLRRQAKFLLTDPYANAYTDKWESEKDRRLNRGGYVFTGNFEVDSGVYFMRFFNRLAQLELKQRRVGERGGGSPSIANSMPQGSAGDSGSQGYTLLGDPTLRSAVTMLIALYRQERDHALGKSEYRYPQSSPWELPGEDGKGNPANWTGMVWGAFRPSDDPQTYAYNIPNNIFLASVLEPMADLAKNYCCERRSEAP